MRSDAVSALTDHSRFAIPDSRFAIHDSRFTIHDSRFPRVTMAVSAVTDLPTRATFVGTIADEHAESGDQLGQLAQPVVDALHREGLLGMWTPTVVPGGAELDPISSLQVIE